MLEQQPYTWAGPCLCHHPRSWLPKPCNAKQLKSWKFASALGDLEQDPTGLHPPLPRTASSVTYPRTADPPLTNVTMLAVKSTLETFFLHMYPLYLSLYLSLSLSVVFLVLEATYVRSLQLPSEKLIGFFTSTRNYQWKTEPTLKPHRASKGSVRHVGEPENPHQAAILFVFEFEETRSRSHWKRSHVVLG